ncbi:MAG: hypothetical protein NTW94_09530 [Legionellales bacterium]|nr:hypothetical protein [Legionellales bacterium]
MNDEKEKFAERLNKALDLAKIPSKGKGRQTQVARLFHVSQESARKWLEGKSFPDTKRILDIARHLSINAQWLLSGIGDISQFVKIKALPSDISEAWIKVPIITWADAASWETLLPKTTPTTHPSWAWAESDIGQNAYALVVENDDMLPRYEPGSILIVDPNHQPAHKHKVIFLLSGETKSTCKQLIIDGNSRYLKPHNPAYPAILLTENDRYCGVVRQVRMRY